MNTIVIKQLLNRESTRHAITLGLGTVLGHLAVTIASPIWSRLYEPADFGRYGLMISYLSTATAAISLRYDLAIPSARNSEESVRLVVLSLFCAIPVSLLAGGIFVWFTRQGFLGFGRLPSWSTAFVILSLALTSIYSTLRFWHVRNSEFGAISVSLVSQGIGRAITPIALAPLKFGWFGLITGELLGRALGIRKLAKPVLPLVRDIFKSTSMRDFGDLLRQYRQYPLVFLPSSVLDAASAVIALPVVVSLFGVSVGGEFLLAQQIVMAPSALISGTLRDIIHSKLIRHAGDNPADLPKLVKRTALRLFLFSSAIYLPLACLAPVLTSSIFGQSWLRVGAFVATLCPAAIVSVAVSPISRAMVFSRIPHIKFAADFAKLLLPVAGMVICARLSSGSVISGLIGYAVMTAVAYAFYFAIVVFSIRINNQLSNGKSQPRTNEIPIDPRHITAKQIILP